MHGLREVLVSLALRGLSRGDEVGVEDGMTRYAQSLSALDRANDVRSKRALVKGELAAGTLRIADLLADPPGCIDTAPVRQLLLALPGFGPVKIRRLLAQCRIADSKTVAGLTERQRGLLIEHLSR
jgi:hypothetical protein